MSEEKTVNECYQYNKDTRAYIEGVESRHGRKLDQIEKDIKELVDKMSNRLPPWVLFYVSFLTLLVGGLLAKAVFK